MGYAKSSVLMTEVSTGIKQVYEGQQINQKACSIAWNTVVLS